MLDRFVGLCLSLLIAAVAVYAAVKLIEAVWATLLVFVAVIGGGTLLGFAAARLLRRNSSSRW